MTPAPPDPFLPINDYSLRAGTTIVRIHDAAFGADAANPGRGSPTRFAPLIRPSPASPIPHLYAAEDYECASHETVFHEVQHDAPVKTIAKAVIDPLRLSRLRLRRDLKLAPLFEPDLNRWAIQRRQLIDTFASAYPQTVKWALAIHASSAVDGLIWTSRRCDPRFAVVLFGDRVQPSDTDILDSEPIASTPSLYAELERFAERAGISIIP